MDESHNNCVEWKELDEKSVDAAGFYFCKISKKCKLVYNNKADQRLLREGRKEWQRGRRKVWGMMVNVTTLIVKMILFYSYIYVKTYVVQSNIMYYFCINKSVKQKIKKKPWIYCMFTSLLFYCLTFPLQ